MQRFTDLKVWQRAHIFAVRIYVLTRPFPGEERYGLTSQLRRAVVSVPANIAEGSKRVWPSDYSRFLNIAQGSAAEVQSLLLLSRDLGFISVETTAAHQAELAEIAGMLEQLRQKVDRTALPPPVLPRRPRQLGSSPTSNSQRPTRPHADDAERVA